MTLLVFMTIAQDWYMVYIFLKMKQDRDGCLNEGTCQTKTLKQIVGDADVNLGLSVNSLKKVGESFHL